MTDKNLYIETFGCQMNDRDSEIMIQLLAESGYLPCADPEPADAIIVNTCTIRAKAEQKAYSLLGSYRRLKKNKPDLLIAVTGCLAQQEGGQMLSRMPHIDLVVGPRSIYDLPSLFKQAAGSKKGIVAIDQADSFKIPPFLPEPSLGLGYKRFVTIMQGCNNFCTYCIVPFTRGREVSRDPEHILAEIRHLIKSGVREITLLGQNVNSYGNDQPPDQRISFADLLTMAATVEGLERLRFTTSNPKDLSPALMQCFNEIDILCPHFHLPMQSGSDKILKKMNRKYSIETYLDKVAGLREVRPDISLTTDIIVGFPGETDEDFAATMEAMEKVRFNTAFSFIYSSRPPARSCEFADDVPDDVKKKRLAIFQKRQQEITLERNNEYVGEVMDIMIEGPSKIAGQWAGRSGTNHVVNFESADDFVAGDIVKVKIKEGCLNSLRSTLL